MEISGLVRTKPVNLGTGRAAALGRLTLVVQFEAGVSCDDSSQEAALALVGAKVGRHGDCTG